MNKKLWVAIATLLFSLFSIAGFASDITSDITTSNSNPNVGEEFTLTATYSTSGQIDKIELDGNSDWIECFGENTCTAQFSITENTEGEKQYTFKVYYQIDNQVKHKSTAFGLTVGSSQENQDSTDNTNDNPSLSIDIPSTKTVQINEQFSIPFSATDNTGLDRIDYKIKNTDNNEVILNSWIECFGETQCSETVMTSLSNSGNYQLLATAYDELNNQDSKQSTIIVDSNEVNQDSDSTDQITIQSSYTPNSPETGNLIKITLDTSYTKGLDRIRFTNENTWFECFGENSCIGEFSFTEYVPGQNTYDFIVYGSEGTEKIHSVSIYTNEQGYSSDEVPAIEITGPTEVTENERFSISVKATDDLGLDRLLYKFKNSNGQIYKQESWECFGEKECVNPTSLEYTLSLTGNYIIEIKAIDSTAHETVSQHQFSVVSANSNDESGDNGNDDENDNQDNDDSSGSSSSGGSGGGGSSSSYAYFVTDPTEIYVNHPITFDASRSKSPTSGIDIIEYTWDFDGDDKNDLVTSGPTVTYTYTKTGVYDVRLWVKDENGRSFMDIKTITVKCCKEFTTNNGNTDSMSTFKITVLDINGDPLENVGITLKSNSSTYGKNTDTQGFAQIRVQPDCYNITAEKEGHVFEQQNQTCVNSDETESITIQETIESKTSEFSITGFLTNTAEKIAERWKVITPIAIILIAGVVTFVLYKTNPFNTEESL